MPDSCGNLVSDSNKIVNVSKIYEDLLNNKNNSMGRN